MQNIITSFTKEQFLHIGKASFAAEPEQNKIKLIFFSLINSK